MCSLILAGLVTLITHIELTTAPVRGHNPNWCRPTGSLYYLRFREGVALSGDWFLCGSSGVT